jgi:hypothetical protein
MIDVDAVLRETLRERAADAPAVRPLTDYRLAEPTRPRSVHRWLVLTVACVGAIAVVVAVAALSAIASHRTAPPISSVSPQPTPSNSASPTPKADYPICAPAQLTLSMGEGGAAMGTAYQAVNIRNVSRATCQLTGFAGVTFTGGTLGASTIVATSDVESGSPATVVLASNGTARFSVATTNPAASPHTCGQQTPDRIVVTVPGGSAPAVDLSWKAAICTDTTMATVVTKYVHTRSGEGVVRVSGYDGPQFAAVRPATFHIDQVTAWRRAHWQVWDSTHAVGRALLYGHGCNPSCATGHHWSGWGTITLHGPFPGCHGHRYFAFISYRLDHRSRIVGLGQTADMREYTNAMCR